MNIDGQNTLACLKRINTDGPKPVKIYPLPHSELLSFIQGVRLDLDAAIVSGLFRHLPIYTSMLDADIDKLSFFSVHCQGSRSRHDPILQAIQVDSALPAVRSA